MEEARTDTLFPEDQTTATPSSAQQSKRQKHLRDLGILVATMLEHYFVTDLTEGERKILLADWQIALELFPIADVKEARRRWLETKERRPTIAEFVRLVGECGGHSDEDAKARAMPPPAWLAPIRKAAYGELDADERWSWHARRRIEAERLGIRGPDPQGKWRNDELERQARAELPPPRAGAQAYIRPPMPDDQETVRPDWRLIRAPDLTEAERRLAEAGMDQLTSQLHGGLEAWRARNDAGWGRRAARRAAGAPAPDQQQALAARAAELSEMLDRSTGGAASRAAAALEREKEKKRAQEELDRAFDDQIPF